jgi:hypothetical protein
MIPGFETVSLQSAGLVPSADGFHWQAAVANDTNGNHANGTNGHQANGTNGNHTNGHHADTDAQTVARREEEFELTL